MVMRLGKEAKRIAQEEEEEKKRSSQLTRVRLLLSLIGEING